VELRFFAGGRERELFRTDAEVPRGGRTRVNVAADLAALEERTRASISNNLANIAKALHDYHDSTALMPRAAAPDALPWPFDPARAERAQREWAAHLDLKGIELADPKLGMKFRLVPPGTFQMGTPEAEHAAEIARLESEGGLAQKRLAQSLRAESPRHAVRLSRPFAIGTFEVTFKQFSTFVTEAKYKPVSEQAGGYGHAGGKLEWARGFNWKTVGYAQADLAPVWNVTDADAMQFCEWLSRETGSKFRLPTEAEWEWACRAGTDGRTFWGGSGPGDAREFAWGPAATKPTKHTPQPVGGRKPNAFGLHDTCGNVWEWCSDWFSPTAYSREAQLDPTGPKQSDVASKNPRRALRGGGVGGGGMDIGMHGTNSAARPAVEDLQVCGFRVVWELAKP
jgi:formylglycine-generating enzyme required for sulfatase activity